MLTCPPISHRHCRGRRPCLRGHGPRAEQIKSSPLRAGGFEEARALEEAGPQLLAFPARLPCQMSSSSVLARVKWEDTEGRRVTVALMAGPAQGNRRLRKGALSQTSYQLLGEMVDTWRRGASRREEWETGLKEKLGSELWGDKYARGVVMLNLCAPCPKFSNSVGLYLWSEGDHSVECLIGAGNCCSSLSWQQEASCQPGCTPCWSG